MTEIQHVRRCSQYLDILVRNNPGYAAWLIEERNINRKYPLTGLYSDLEQSVEAATSFNDLLGIFRRFKQRHFLRIGARDLLGYADLVETTGQLSDLASVALQIGLDTLFAHPDWWSWGEDAGELERFGGEFSLVVLGLGKLGGHELNYVSDIDLIFLSAATGETDDAGSHPAIVSRIAHYLTRLVSDRFEGDRVFLIDFRLRPQGKDGILVPSMGAAVEHYLLHGRAWERQMLLKCRPVAGDRSAGNSFIREVRPFVFRRFLDFQALSELMEMRNKILTEAARFGPGARQFDVKLGLGGIREIEFLAQSMQLIYGGRHPELDEPNHLRCLEKLGALGLFPGETVSELRSSYIFLRNVEHYIQLDQNRQTQRLPRSVDARARLVLAMGFGDDEKAFLNALEEHCSKVHASFSKLFQESGGEESEGRAGAAVRGGAGTGLDLFPPASLSRLRETLKSFPPSVEAEVLKSLEGCAQSTGEELREKVLVRFDTYFSRVGRRPGLKKLFGAEKPWVSALCGAIASSELFSGLLAHNPGLVEGIAVRQKGFSAAAEWGPGASRLLDRANDYEEKLEWIRRLKNERVLQLVLADQGGEIGFAGLEEEMTVLADFVIRNTLEAVRLKLGMPPELPLSVLAMGKLGSGEMSYLSDLDLVFVYEPRAGEAANQIPGPMVRLIQRFMNMLNTPLQEGPGYAVDARLRPTGNYGPLVVTKESWLNYYGTQADIWEIQALLRARHVAGDDALGRWVEERAEEICYAQRGPDAVWPRICHLRDRMEKERAQETPTEIDLKLGMGGLADIEFLVQGNQLVEGHGNRAAVSRSVRRAVGEFLKTVPEISGMEAEISAAFGALRALDHRLRLHANSSSARIGEAHFEAMKALGLWPPRFDGASIETWQDLLRLRREVRAIFRRFCPI
ncbi:MAG: hypothetical protein WAW37_15425 [Syntrophobacteraceae bacterium]